MSIAENEKTISQWVKETEAELRAYRAIGSVEDIQMVFQLCKDLQVMCGQYNDIGTVSEFRELKEKATAKTARLKKGIYHCPSCGMAFAVVEQGYCIFCGQHMC